MLPFNLGFSVLMNILSFTLNKYGFFSRPIMENSSRDIAALEQESDRMCCIGAYTWSPFSFFPVSGSLEMQGCTYEETVQPRVLWERQGHKWPKSGHPQFLFVRVVGCREIVVGEGIEFLNPSSKVELCWLHGTIWISLQRREKTATYRTNDWIYSKSISKRSPAVHSTVITS